MGVSTIDLLCSCCNGLKIERNHAIEIEQQSAEAASPRDIC
jgi:hypothetical protein